MSENSEWSKNNISLPDEGPLYAETNLHNIVAEPWNGISSLTFLIPAIYWLIKIKWKFRNNPVVFISAILLTLGGLGSAFFHAFRISRFFVLMDVLPIIALCLLTSIYLWYKVWGKFIPVIIMSILFFVSSYITFKLPDISAHNKININYFIRGVFMLLPSLLLLVKFKFKGVLNFVLALFFLSLALLFRKIDSDQPPLLHMGTHWLWHVCCALGAYFMGRFVFDLDKSKDE